MRDTATDSGRSHESSSGFLIGGICGVFLAVQIVVVTLVPPRERAITAVLLTMVTVVVLIVAAMEFSFKRAAKRGARAEPAAPSLPRRPLERVSPLIQRAYYLAQRDAPAWHIAGTCEIPEAFAVLIIDDVRRSRGRKGRAADRPQSDDRKPNNPPAI